MANIKRFTINQHWQQISTGNVTLTGCNTAAIYHIFVGNDTPTGDSDFISDTLAQSTPYNFDTPVWVKLNVTNQVDEADMIAIGELAQTVDTGNTASTLTFSELTNCTYDGEKLIYTSGVLDLTGSAGYQAVSDRVQDFETIISGKGNNYFFIGASKSFDDYQGAVPQGVQIQISASDIIFFDATGNPNLGIATSIGHKIKVSVKDSKVTITNLDTNQSFTSVANNYLANPKYLYIINTNHEDTNIKAI